MKKELKKLIKKSLDDFKQFYKLVESDPEKLEKIIEEIETVRKAKMSALSPTDKIIVKITDKHVVFDAFGDDPKSWIIASSFIISIVSKYPEYQEIIDKINEWFPEGTSWGQQFKIESKKPGKIHLMSLLTNIIALKLENKLSEELIDKYIEIFYQVNKDKIFEFMLFYSIAGIDLRFEEIDFSNGIILKKGKESDYKSLEELIYFRKKTIVNLPKVLLKISKKVKFIRELIDLEKKAFYFFKLYKFSNVFTYEHYRHVVTVSGQGRLDKIDVIKPNLWFKPYIIYQKDKEKIVELFNLLSSSFDKIFTDEKLRSYIIALERYEWALMGNYDFDRRLLFVLMGLEALYQKDDKERFNQLIRLSMRLPKLFKYLGWNPNKIQQIIRKAYYYRSKIAHGGDYGENWETDIKKLFPEILNYLRISLLFFLYRIPVTKNTNIALIDESLLIDSKDNELKSIIEEFSLLFKPCLSEKVDDLLLTLEDFRIKYNIS